MSLLNVSCRGWKSQLFFKRNEPRIEANRVKFGFHRHEYRQLKFVER
jgi:hypothetical protein